MRIEERAAVLATAALLALCPAAGAVEVATRDVLISRGSLGEIADPTGKRRLKNHYAYLFPGAKLVPVAGQPPGLPAGQMLAHAENGLLVFVRQSSLLNQADLRKLATAGIGAVGFITENTGFRWPDPAAGQVVGLGRQEYYPVVGRDDFKVTLRIDVCAKLAGRAEACRGTPGALLVDVPVDRERVGVVELAQFDAPRMAFAAPMRSPVRSAVEGLTKHCREKVVRTFEAGGRFGVNVEAYFINLGLDASKETQRVLDLPESVQVDVRYFTRDDGYLRRFVVEQPCEGDARPYRFQLSRGPDATDSLEAIVETAFWRRLGLVTHPSTQKPEVRCAAQYWRLFTGLVEMQVDERDAAFFMARMMTLSGFDDASCLEATRALDTPTAGGAAMPARG
jgi:hypothetical protein